MKPALSTIIKTACEKKTLVDKIRYLQENESEPLKQILQWTFDSRIKWNLPPGEPPYKPCQYIDQEGMLYQECRRLHLFVHGSQTEMTPLKRESLYIGMLEALHPEDAKLVLSMKDKKLPYEGLSIQTINEAFPGLIHE